MEALGRSRFLLLRVFRIYFRAMTTDFSVVSLPRQKSSWVVTFIVHQKLCFSER